MTELHIASLQRRLSCKIFQDVGILHLGKTNKCTSHVRQHISTHISKGSGHILQFVGILHTIPSLGRQIFIIILTRIMTGIKEILLIVESNSIYLKLFTTRSL